MINWEKNFIHKYNVEINGFTYKLEIKTCEINEDTIEELQYEFEYGEHIYWEPFDDTEYLEPIEMGKDFVALFVDGYWEHYVVGKGKKLLSQSLRVFLLDKGGRGNENMSVEEIFKLNNWRYTYEKY